MEPETSGAGHSHPHAEPVEEPGTVETPGPANPTGPQVPVIPVEPQPDTGTQTNNDDESDGA